MQEFVYNYGFDVETNYRLWRICIHDERAAVNEQQYSEQEARKVFTDQLESKWLKEHRRADQRRSALS